MVLVYIISATFLTFEETDTLMKTAARLVQRDKLYGISLIALPISGIASAAFLAYHYHSLAKSKSKEIYNLKDKALQVYDNYEKLIVK
jgi:uncharacterized membrane protein